MINLLPNEHKASILYARRNTHLLKWIFGALAAILIVVIIIGAGHFYMADAQGKVEQSVNETRQELEEQKLEETQNKIQNISNNLKLIIQVLSRQVLFSELLIQIGSVMPSNTVLSGIDIGELEGGIDLTARALNHQRATQVQVNLEDPANKIFEKVDIVSINCDETDDQYPCVVTLRAEFTKDNPFLFINKNDSSEEENE